MPQLHDPNFRRTVVLLCEHGEEGAFGLVLNRKTDTPVSSVVRLTPPVEVDNGLQLFDAGGIGNCILGGASLGGWIAAEMASMEPGRFAGLVLTGSQGTATGEMNTPDLFLMPYRRYISFGYNDARSAAFQNLWAGELDDDAVTHDLEVMELAALLGFKPYMHDRSLLPALSRFTNPALLLWGANDVITPPAVAERFLNALPAAELVTIGDAGHYAHLEKPIEFADAVTGFAAGLKAD